MEQYPIKHTSFLTNHIYNRINRIKSELNAFLIIYKFKNSNYLIDFFNFKALLLFIFKDKFIKSNTGHKKRIQKQNV